MDEELERYFSIGDTAKRFGVVPATVKAMVARGRLRPAARTEGGIRLFHPVDVERLARERAVRGTDELASGANRREEDDDA